MIEGMVQATHDTSSIGPMWPPRETSFNRIKGFYNTGIVRKVDELDHIFELVYGLSQDVISGRVPQDRVSVRVILGNNLLAERRSLFGLFGEAVIPLEGTQPELEDCSILYLGANGDDRRSDSFDLERGLDHLASACSRPPHSAREMLDRINIQGYRISIANNMTWKNSEHVEQLVTLYARFGWERADVLAIIKNPNNIITTAFQDDQIVAAGIAELSVVSLGENGDDRIDFRMVELTEAATLKEHQGKGLYSAVATRSLIELIALSDQRGILGGSVDLAYGECNSLSIGVLNAVKSQWRTFAPEVSERMGVNNIKGYLPQHVPISGVSRQTEYNDLFPAFISREKMEEFVNS